MHSPQSADEDWISSFQWVSDPVQGPATDAYVAHHARVAHIAHFA